MGTHKSQQAMSDDESSGVGSEEMADEEILAQVEALEAGDDAAPAAGAVDCDHQGNLYIKQRKKGLKKGKKWKFYKCYLKGSSLWYYRPQEENPKAVIELAQKFDIGDDELTANESRPNTFSIKKPDLSLVWIFAAPSEKEKDAWLDKLKPAFSAPSAKAPTGAMRRKSSLILRAKKKVAGKAATSGVGKRLIKSVMHDDDVDKLFASGKALIARDTDQKRATQIEDTVIKLAVKGIMLVRNGSLPIDKARPLEPVMRQLGKDLKETWNDRIRFKKDDKKLREASDANYAKLAAGVQQMDTLLRDLFDTYVTERTLSRIGDVTDYLGKADTFKRLYETESQQDDLKVVLERVAFYLQFY